MARQKKEHKTRLTEQTKIAYVNDLSVQPSPAEFILKFIALTPGFAVHPIEAQLTIAPLVMKEMVALLNDGIRRYEEAYGLISDVGGKALAEELFTGKPPRTE